MKKSELIIENEKLKARIKELEKEQEQAKRDVKRRIASEVEDARIRRMGLDPHERMW